MRCLSTRLTPDGFKRRRYELEPGVRFSTIEVPVEVWQGINRAGRGNDRTEAWQRARTRDRLQCRALEHQREGRSARESARMLGVALRTVQRWRRRSWASSTT